MRKKAFRLLMSFLLLAGLLGGLGHIFMQAQLARPLAITKAETLVVKPGMSLQALGQVLVERGWISHPYFLIFEGKRSGKAAFIQAGEYIVQPGTSQAGLLALLVSGKVIQYSLTLVEGWSFAQVMLAVKTNPYLQHTLAESSDETASAQLMQALGHPDKSPEGRFFPDTYYFPRSTSDLAFLKRAYSMMEEVLAEEWQQRAPDLPYASAYEALIMASIIEKETAIHEEYPQIAGVFVRRLGKGMKLQTDPTVIYALGSAFDGNLRRRDLSVDSPYNTYVYKGLPPTPIALPGRAALRAALHPERGEALYFVAKGDGSHYFSKNLQEHNRAVKKYQLKQ